MITSTHLLAKAAEKLEIKTTFIDKSESVLILHFLKHDHFVVNTKLGLTTNAEEIIGKDKSFQYELLKDELPLPKTKSYVDSKSRYQKFAEFDTNAAIQKDIEAHFIYPFILKKNTGSRGVNVFRVTNSIELQEKISLIFNQQDSEYDFVLLAQQYIKPVKEYRVLIYDGQIALAYLKDTSNATFTGNLSPLHWENATTSEVTDPEKLRQFEKICQKLYSVWKLKYGGLDIIEDEFGTLWLIEVNTNPSSALFIKDNGEEKILQLYSKILEDLQAKYHSA